MQGLSPAAAEFREHLVAGCYEHHDLLLGQLLHQVGKDTHLIAVSLAGHGTATTQASDEATALPRTGTPTRNLGLAVIRGPGVRHVSVPLQRSILDLAPTICAMLAVPYASDLGGRCWLDLFEVDLKPKVVDLRKSDTTVESSDAMDESNSLIGDETASGRVQDQSVEHLVELGYVDPHDLVAQEASEHCRRMTELNRALSLMDAGLLAQATACLEQLAHEHPDWFNSHAVLAEAYYRANQWRSARSEIEWLMCRGIEQPQLYFLSAAIEFASRQYDLALEELRCAGRAGIVLPGLRALEGEIHLRKRNFGAAETAFRSSIELEGPTLQSLDGLATVGLYFDRYEEAAANAFDALAMEMRFGRAHYHLAVALLQLDKPHEALRAMETWAAVEPQAAAPFRWMARVCELRLDDLPRAADYRAQGREVVRRRRESLIASPAVGTSAPSSAP
jgi:tetratricopeptide (TPR) repeat protein